MVTKPNSTKTCPFCYAALDGHKVALSDIVARVKGVVREAGAKPDWVSLAEILNRREIQTPEGGQWGPRTVEAFCRTFLGEMLEQ